MRIRLNHTTLAMGSGVVIIILTSLALATDPLSVRQDQKARATPDINSPVPQPLSPPSDTLGMYWGAFGTAPPYIQVTWTAIALTPMPEAPSPQVTLAGGLEDLPLCPDEVYTPSLTDTPIPDLSDAPAACRLNSTVHVGFGPP
jgi:hypothetical protein